MDVGGSCGGCRWVLKMQVVGGGFGWWTLVAEVGGGGRRWR